MNHDAISALTKAISSPIATMTVATVDSPAHAHEIVNALTPTLQKRPWEKLPISCVSGETNWLLKEARRITTTWPAEAGVLFLTDNTHANRRPEEGVEFWRAMNLQRETWSSLNCHLVFLLTLQNYEQLLTIADHLASWIPIKLDARRPYPDIGADHATITSSGFEIVDSATARQRIKELELSLAETLAKNNTENSPSLARRYYLPILEAALVANDPQRAYKIYKTAEPDHIPEEDKPRWWQAVCQICHRTFHLEEAKKEAQRYLAWAEYNQNIKETGSACTALGEILYASGNFNDARSYFERALKIDEGIFGLNHPKVAIDINNLGNVKQILGDFAGAYKHFVRAIAIFQTVYGDNHPSVATLTNNLGLLLLDKGDFSEARKHFERALAIDENIYGPNHSNIARDANNLGLALRSLGEIDGARACFDRALAIDEAVYGKEHPNVAIEINNLARIFWMLGDFKQAKAYMERALATDTAAYGPNHPSVARDYNNLGGIMKDMGDIKGARTYLEKALSIYRISLGENSPDTKNAAANLAALDG